ncbi:hypothetical protein ABZ490_40585 [Streptomyces sp. NPDC005811]|uniref:hypothetical protein n=1 Tax=Streptomyces sp. NPDC005811 TaxID=3154565 RepID=UPI0033CF55E8
MADSYWVDQGTNGEKVKVGRTITVTMDPKGKIPLSTGRRADGILFLTWAAFRGITERLASKTTDHPERTPEPEDSPV